MADLNKTVQIIFGATDKSAAAFNDVNSRIGTLDSSFGGLGGQAARLTKDLALMATGLVTAAGVFGAFAAKEAAEFETSIANINTLLSDAGEKDLPAIQKGIKDLALTVPVELADLALAFYDIQSGTGAGVDGLGILDVAARAAVGGMSDTKTAASALITVLNSYGLTAGDAGRISDIMFGTVKEGVLTFSDLAANVGKVSATGRAANQTFETTGAAIAALTGATGQQAESFTKLEQLYNKLSTKKVADEFAKFGIDVRGINDELRPLNDIIGEVTQKQLSFQQILEIFPEKEAAAAVLILSQNYDSFTKKLAFTETSTGEAEKAFRKMADTFNNIVRTLKNAWDVFLQGVGKPIIDELKPVISKLTEAMKSVEAQATAGAIGEAFANWIDGISTFIEGLDGVFQKVTGIKDASTLVSFANWVGDVDTIKASLKAVTTIVGGIAMSVALVHDAFVGTANFIAVELLVKMNLIYAAVIKILQGLDYIPGLDLSGPIKNLQAQSDSFARDWQDRMKSLSGPDLYWSDNVTNTILGIQDAIAKVGTSSDELATKADKVAASEKKVLDVINDQIEAKNKQITSKDAGKQIDFTRGDTASLAALPGENTQVERMRLEAQRRAQKIVSDTSEKSVEGFKSISEIMGDSGKTITEIGRSLVQAGRITEGTDVLRQSLQKEIEKKEKIDELQQKLLDQQVKLNDAKIKQAEAGGALIKISADGLQAELEAFMWQILERIQIRANAEGAEYLLGI
jgi:TP901 family phage tail tape measure protein